MNKKIRKHTTTNICDNMGMLPNQDNKAEATFKLNDRVILKENYAPTMDIYVKKGSSGKIVMLQYNDIAYILMDEPNKTLDEWDNQIIINKDYLKDYFKKEGANNE